MTKQQIVVLTVLDEHKRAGGRGIANDEIDREADRRHNRTFGYDALHSVLKRLECRGLVKRDKHRPARWAITAAGSKLVGAQRKEK